MADPRNATKREHIMPKYLLAYHGGGMAETEEAQQAAMAAWGAWMGQHEAAFADMGAPTMMNRTVDSGGDTDGGGANPVTGYGLINADDMAGACSIAAGCPIVADGGSVEVSECIDMMAG